MAAAASPARAAPPPLPATGAVAAFDAAATAATGALEALAAKMAAAVTPTYEQSYSATLEALADELGEFLAPFERNVTAPLAPSRFEAARNRAVASLTALVREMSAASLEEPGIAARLIVYTETLDALAAEYGEYLEVFGEP